MNSKPHTLSMSVVMSSSTRTPNVSAMRTVLGHDALSLAHTAWRNEAPAPKPGGGDLVVGAGYVHSPWTLG